MKSCVAKAMVLIMLLAFVPAPLTAGDDYGIDDAATKVVVGLVVIGGVIWWVVKKKRKNAEVVALVQSLPTEIEAPPEKKKRARLPRALVLGSSKLRSPACSRSGTRSYSPRLFRARNY